MKAKRRTQPTKSVRAGNPPWEWAATHLGDRSVFGIPMFVAYLVLTEIMRLSIFGFTLYSSLLDTVTDWSWLLLSRATIYFSLAWLLNLISKRLRTPGVNLMAAASISILALTSDFYFYPEDGKIFMFGVVPTIAYMAALTVVAYALFAPVLIDLRSYRDGAIALAESQARLKANLEEIAFKSKLAEQIRRSQLEAIVVPQIVRLRASLGKTADSATASIEKIREIIENNVRPLSREMLSTRAQLRPITIARPVASVTGAFFYKRPLADAFQPILWTVTLSPIYVIGDIAVFGFRVVWASIIATLIWALSLLGLKLLIPSSVRVNGLAASAITGFMAFVIWIPIDRQIALEMADTTSSQVITLAAIADTFGLIFLMTLSREISRSVAEVLNEKNTQSAELKVKVSDFNRSEWVHQRNWSYLLHGKIQAGLSVALIKLSQMEDTTNNLGAAHKKRIIKEVGKIIDDVVQVLQDPKVMEVDLYGSLAQQQELWGGVCEIKLALPEEVEVALAKDVEARFALNEMACEAVVNAVKHAGSKSLQLSFSFEQPNTVVLKAVNDGKAPSKDSRKSLGASLFDDLTESWSLVRNGKKTTLTAKVRIGS